MTLRHLIFPTLVLTAVLVLASSTEAKEPNENIGTTGFGFLKIGIGARPAALGGAFVAVPGDVNAIAWNPAALASILKRAGTLTYTNYLLDTQAGFLGATKPLEGKGTIGAGMSYLTYGEFRKKDEAGNDLGPFGAGDLALHLSWGKVVWRDQLSAGVTAKILYSRIDVYASDAYAVDLGFLFSGPLPGMTLGAAILNVGAVRSGYSGDFKDTLPTNIKFGIAHHLAHLPVMLAGELSLPNDNDPYFSFGGEFSINDYLFIRPGYTTISSGLDQQAGLSAGVGFAWQEYKIDYAFSSFAELGDVHRLSLSGDF